MPEQPLRNLVHRLRRLADPAADGGLSDSQLLERFVSRRDEAAFEVLVWRHGAMVLGVCRRLLRHDQDAEDAFQATFLALVRQAGSIRRREAVAAWLYRVAYRVALEARALAAAQAQREQPCPDLPAPDASNELVWRDLRPVLDEEVNSLPEKYRTPFILCYLQGKTNEEAARQLGCPRGTVLSRLARARERLRSRLARRGIGITGALFAMLEVGTGLAAVSGRLVQSTCAAAHGIVLGKTAAAVASGQVATLLEGALQTMSMSRLKLTLSVLLAVVLLGLGAGAASSWGRASGSDGSGSGSGGEPVQVSPGKQPAPRPAPDSNAHQPARKQDDPKAAVRLVMSQNNLKQIGLALHNHHDTYKYLPGPAIYSKDGKALLSWRVAILPWIEQDALYRQFKLDEPWDSPHNLKLLDQMPAIYALPGDPAGKQGMTHYQAFAGKDTGFEPRKKLRLNDFVDGTSNTIIVVEASSPVPWTKPEDLPYVADQALPRLGVPAGNDFNALFGDGSVRLLSGKANEKMLRRAITRNDGEVVDVEQLSAPAAGTGPGGKVDLEQLVKENRKLKDLVTIAQQAIATLEEEVAILKRRLVDEQSKKETKTRPQLDARAVELMREHEELRRLLERTLGQLQALQAERDYLKRKLSKQ
jgi:RNA polymerase sigma factor (sigma-70 family)